MNMARYLFLFGHETDDIHDTIVFLFLSASGTENTYADIERSDRNGTAELTGSDRRPSCFQGFLLELAFVSGQTVAEFDAYF